MDTGYAKGVDVMDVATVKSWIQTKQIPNFMIFSGPEWAVQKIYINKIAETVDGTLKYVDGIAEIYNSLRSRNLIGKKNVYVIRDDRDILTNEKLQGQINTGLLGSNTLIYLLTTVDKRTKFYKTYKDTIVDFEPLKPAILKKYIQKEIDLSDKNTEKLMEVCEYDYGRCLLEIDKIYQFSNYYMRMPTAPVDYNEVFDLLLKSGTIYQPPKDAIFDLVDAILDRKVNESFNLLEQSYAVGEATMVMLSVLYTNAKVVLQVQSCEERDVAKNTGLSGWQIMNARKHVGKYRNGELVHILRLVRECEKGIKIGQYEDRNVMEYILISVL